jgi:hypothetical protein
VRPAQAWQIFDLDGAMATHIYQQHGLQTMRRSHDDTGAESKLEFNQLALLVQRAHCAIVTAATALQASAQLTLITSGVTSCTSHAWRTCGSSALDACNCCRWKDVMVNPGAAHAPESSATSDEV